MKTRTQRLGERVGVDGREEQRSGRRGDNCLYEATWNPFQLLCRDISSSRLPSCGPMAKHLRVPRRRQVEDDLPSNHRPLLLSRSRDHRSGAKPWHRCVILGELTVVLVEGHSAVGRDCDLGARSGSWWRHGFGVSFLGPLTPTVRDRHGFAAGIHLPDPTWREVIGSGRNTEVGTRQAQPVSPLHRQGAPSIFVDPLLVQPIFSLWKTSSLLPHLPVRSTWYMGSDSPEPRFLPEMVAACA